MLATSANSHCFDEMDEEQEQINLIVESVEDFARSFPDPTDYCIGVFNFEEDIESLI